MWFDMTQVTGTYEATYALLSAGVTGATSEGHSPNTRYGERLIHGEMPQAGYMTRSGFFANQIALAKAVEARITNEDVVVVAAAYDLSFTGHVVERALEAIGATALSVGTSNTICPMARTLGLMRFYHVSALVGTPQVVLDLARLDRSMNAAALHTLRTVVFIGGSSTPRRLERIADLWGAAKVQVFGSALMPAIGVPCARGEIHLSDNRVSVELGHPSSARIATGGKRGELLLRSRETPRQELAATATGELVELWPTSQPCKCGEAGPVLIPLGPLSDTIAMEYGRVSAIDVERVAYDCADLDPDLRCDTDGTRFRLSCTPKPGEPNSGAGLTRRLRARLRSELGIDARVDVRPADTASSATRTSSTAPREEPGGEGNELEQAPHVTKRVGE